MNQNSGVYVFRDEYFVPILIAYKKLPNMKYLTLLHYSNVIFSNYLTYSSLLNMIPIRSVQIHVYLPILVSKNGTILNWYRNIVDAMENYHKYGYFKPCTQ